MQKYVIALYIRLSIEDYKYDSLSIENQSLVLHEYAASMPEALNAEITEFIDNGYSGTNFERPQVQKLIELVRANQIDCIIVKDFSRFGRNSIETGYFIERVFPLFHTRFISISDDFDSSKFKGDTGGMDVAFKYLISEYYSRDMSIKTKSAKYAKMQRGEYQSKICPYGYRKSADGRMEPESGGNPLPDISRCHGIWVHHHSPHLGGRTLHRRVYDRQAGGSRSRRHQKPPGRTEESWYHPRPSPGHRRKLCLIPCRPASSAFPAATKSGLPAERPMLPLAAAVMRYPAPAAKTSYYYCRRCRADVESAAATRCLNAAKRNRRYS